MSKITTVIALAGLVGLAGCAGGQQLTPPGLPTIASIQATETQLGTVTNIPDFYKVGLFLAQEQCGGYFDEAVMAALKNARSAGQAQLLSGLLTGLMGLAGGPAGAISGVGLATTFGQNLLSNQQDTSLAGSDPAATATLVAAAQSALIRAESDPATAADAYADIYAVYRACSPAGIRGLEEQAIAAAPSHLAVSGTAPATEARFGALMVAKPVLPSVTVR